MTAAADGHARRSVFSRLVGEVRPGEGVSAAVLAGTLFTLLGAYYMLKVARETLVLSHYAAEQKVYISAGQAALLVPTVWFYGWLATRVGRVRLYTIGTGFFVVTLAVFAVLNVARVTIGLPFFLWVGIFNVFVIAQLWAFANDVYSEEQGRRIFPIIGIGSSLGAITGSYSAGPLGDAIGTTALLVIPIVLLVVTMVGVRWVHARTGAGKHPAAETTHARNGWALLFSDKYLVLIAVMMLVLNCENTIGEYLLDRVMKSDLAQQLLRPDQLEGRIRDFKSIYFASFNTAGFLLQLFVTGRVMKKGGAGLGIMVLPVVALAGLGGMIVTGAALAAVATAKVAENSVDYSVQNTARNALFLVTPPEVKYKVKVLIDSVVVRGGDMLAGATVLLLAGVLHLGVMPVVGVSATVTVLWLGVAWTLRREHARRAEEALAVSASGAAAPPTAASRR